MNTDKPMHFLSILAKFFTQLCHDKCAGVMPLSMVVILQVSTVEVKIYVAQSRQKVTSHDENIMPRSTRNSAADI